MSAILDLPFKLTNPDLFRDQSYIGGKWTGAKSGKSFEVIDPGTGKPFASCPNNGPEDVDAAVQAAHSAFQTYSKLNPRKRAQLLLAWHNLIIESKDDLAQILTHETGKPLAESIGELDYALGFTWWFAGEAERIRGTVSVPAAPDRRVFTIKQAIGPVCSMVPWNFPIAMILRKCGAAFAAGCTMVIKPSPETPLTTLSLAYLAEKAGFEAGVMNVITTDLENTPALSEALCRHELIKKVTFTGSTRVGKLIARICADGLKKTTLELGGNCPVLIFDDADLEQAAAAVHALKFRHAGQACITANRIYVQRGVYQKVTDMMLARTKALKIGHGAKEGTTLGPVTTPRSIEKAKAHVEDARKKGAKILCGGNEIKYGMSGGYFFEPTLITEASGDLLLSEEEQFSPIMALYPFETEEEAVKAANATSMGLASYFFTKDVDRTWRLLENLEAGMIGMNTGNSSAAESPFGGIKESGYGKESGLQVAVDEYCIMKTGTLTLSGHY